MELESVPPEKSCLGCKRYFLRGEKLPLESMVVEFKNYSFPIKGSFLKLTLLKTIVGFMNSKGGTLYMGVDDASGNVEGVTLGRKQMDQFKLMIKAMLEKVQPAVDLVKSEQVSVQFVPVLEGKDKGFYGRYVVKFIVLQGDPSKLYCISEKVKTTGVKPEDVEVISAFRRHTLGGLQEVKGIRVIHQIYQKARNPHNVAKTFHENCNPQPIYPMLLERPKTENIPQIFADEDSEEDVNKVNVSPNRIQSESLSQSFSNSSSQASEPETIIDLIKDEIEMEKQNNKLPQLMNVIFFENVRPDAYKSCINFMKNSTHAKYSKEICEQRGFIKVVFNTSADKSSMLENMEKPTLRKLLNDFGISGKVNILQNLTFKNQIKKQNLIKIQQNEFNYAILFYNYKKQDEESIRNYLQKCISGNITRKLKKKKSGQEGLEMTFKKESQLNVFMSLCSNPPHSTQLRNFWGKEGVKMKRYTKTNANAKENTKQEKNETKKSYIAKNHSQQQQNHILIPTKIQAEPIYQKENKFTDVLQLVASNLEPSEVPKLTNYMVNSMFYNIQKKILGSKDRYYIRIVFNQAKDCQRFGEICLIEQHKKILAQFSGTKSLRIGIPGDNLLIYPYSDKYKDEIKKIVTSLLGQGAIRKSVIKQLGNDQKVWSLALNDASKLFEYYQKLESYFRKEGIFLNQEWVRFKVYLDYKYLIE